MAEVNNFNSASSYGGTLWMHWGRNGGGPRFLYELVRGALDDGYSPVAISYSRQAEIVGRFEDLDCEQFPVETFSNKFELIVHIPNLILTGFRLRKWLRNHKISRVVCVMESVYQSAVVPFFLPRGIEYVVCVHDGEAHPGEYSIVRAFQRKAELFRANRIVVFSEAVGTIIRKKTTTDLVVANHPPFGDLKRTEPKTIQNRQLIIGFFGRLQEYKGIPLLLKAAEILQARSKLDFSLRIVGHGPEAKWKNSELGKYAEWQTGWVEDEEVDEIVGDFDVMVLPYVEASQSGPVALAISNGVPCVATPVGGLPAQIDGFGIVSTECSASAFADALEKLLTNPDLYKALSLAAIKEYEESMSWGELSRVAIE